MIHFIVVVLALMMLSAVAADTARHQEGRSRPGQASSERGKPAEAPPSPWGRVESAFDWTLGTWRGVRRDVADGSDAPMSLRVEPILDGAGQIRHLEVRHAGGIYRGFAVQVLDRERGHWVRQYVNSTRGTFARLECEVVEAARSIWRSAARGRRRESRLVSERVGTERWLRTLSISEDGGQTWRVLWIDDLARDSAAAEGQYSRP